MLIGTPTEVKNAEKRVGLTPASVRELVAHGHEVLVQHGAGLGIGATDADYRAAGASLATDATEVFAEAEMVVKVKEPQPSERAELDDVRQARTFAHRRVAARAFIQRVQTPDLGDAGHVLVGHLDDD